MKKKNPKPFRARFENTMGNPIFNFFCCWSKRSKKNFTIEIWTFSFQNCFQNQFWTLRSGQTENTQILICVFSVQNWFWKQFWNEKVHISVVKKKFGAFRSTTTKKLKIGFPIVFSNLVRKGLGFFLHAKRKFFHQTPCIYLLNSRGGSQTSDFDFTHLSEYPNIGVLFRHFSC